MAANCDAIPRALSLPSKQRGFSELPDGGQLIGFKCRCSREAVSTMADALGPSNGAGVGEGVARDAEPRRLCRGEDAF